MKVQGLKVLRKKLFNYLSFQNLLRGFLDVFQGDFRFAQFANEIEDEETQAAENAERNRRRKQKAR